MFVVCVTEQNYVSILFTLLWSVRTAILFRYKGILVISQQKAILFVLRFIFAGCLVLHFTHAQLRILKFLDSVYL